MADKSSMGQTLAKTPAAASEAVATRERKLHFRVRCDEISPQLLERVAQARVDRLLGSVQVDCNKRTFDADKMELLEKAAGISKLILQC